MDNHCYSVSKGCQSTANYNVFGGLRFSSKANKERDMNCLLVTNTYSNAPERIQLMQKNWQYFASQVKKVSGLYVIQSLGTIAKSIKTLRKDKENNRVSLAEKIKLFKSLEENETVIDFIFKENLQEKKKIENKENENILLPQAHPENTTSLLELESKIKSLTTLIENKRPGGEEKKKLNQLLNLYQQEKTILFENENQRQNEEIIRSNQIDLTSLSKEEEQKRQMAEREEHKIIETFDWPPKNKEIKKKGVSIEELEIKSKIFVDQATQLNIVPWIDPMFGPEKKSLCPFNAYGWIVPEGIDESNLDGWSKYKWHKTEEIMDSKRYLVLKNPPDRNDIVEGSMNNC